MSQEPHDRYVKANEEAWNQVTPIHMGYRRNEAEFYKSGGVSLDNIELKFLSDIKGKDVAHFSCNCGQDTLSLSNLGGKCVGFDLSERALEEARKLSLESGVPATFVHANVLNIPDEYNSRFDLVYMSRGALVWLPDMKMLMKNIAKVLRTGGSVLIHDQHPFMHLMDENEFRISHDYFNKEPEEFKGLDYIGNSVYDALPNYQYMVRISDILNGLTENSLRLTGFYEHDKTFFRQFTNLVEDAEGFFSFSEDENIPRFPMMMTILAEKV